MGPLVRTLFFVRAAGAGAGPFPLGAGRTLPEVSFCQPQAVGLRARGRAYCHFGRRMAENGFWY